MVSMPSILFMESTPASSFAGNVQTLISFSHEMFLKMRPPLAGEML
jgi:hypothetical protein